MRIFALETNVRVYLNEYLIEGEEELLITHFHWMKLIFKSYTILILTFIFTLAYLYFLATEPEDILFFTSAYIGWLLRAGWKFLNAYISYRYSYLVVTSEKILEITHESLFSQKTNPMHLDSVISTDEKSMLFGLFNMGVVVVNLTERTKYSSKQVEFEFLPNSNIVAGIIENALVINKQDLLDADINSDEVLEEVQEKSEHVANSTPLNQDDEETT